MSLEAFGDEGEGATEEDYKDCPDCGGSGTLSECGIGGYPPSETCSTCEGTGQVLKPLDSYEDDII